MDDLLGVGHRLVWRSEAELGRNVGQEATADGK